jgi:ArsR family transcriptional regulator
MKGGLYDFSMETSHELLGRLNRLADIKQDIRCPAPVMIRELQGCVLSLPQTVLDKEAAIARSLSDPTRLRILHLFSKRRELCVCEIQAAIHESQPLTSHHLRELRKAGLVKSRRSGTWVYYSLASDKLTMMLKILRELGCLWKGHEEGVC